MKYYSGIGSRLTPKETLDLMTKLARILNDKGYILRSGGAYGADTAFANGAGTNKEIFRPHHATTEAIEIAMNVHPAPRHCKPYVKKLHGRNVQILLGKELDKPVEFVVCWAANEQTGGTSLGIRIAKKFKISCFNLAKEKDFIKISSFLTPPFDKFW